MMNFLQSFYDAIKSRLGDTSKWGQWVGALIIIDILGVWTVNCVKKGEILVIDNTQALIVLTVFLMNALKSTTPAVTVPIGTKEPTVTGNLIPAAPVSDREVTA